MASQDYRQIVKHWADWKLIRASGNRYDICRYNHRQQEDFKATINADDDAAAIKHCRSIIQKIDRKKAS